jgi:phosphate transport system substrate-binding protein
MAKNMVTGLKVLAILSMAGYISVVACKDDCNEVKETILQGELTVFVDESIRPLIEDEAAIFDSQYPGKIKIVSKPEAEIVNLMMTGKASVAFLTRHLTENELSYFKSKKISGRVTPLATDAVTFVTNRQSADTLIDLSEVIKVLQGKPSSIRGLVFENPNSSVVRYMDSIAGTKPGEKNNVYSMANGKEVLKYVSDNKGFVGVMGLNLLVQPDTDIEELVTQIHVCGVKSVKGMEGDTQYYKPNQSNLGAELYPLTRKVYVLNYQASAGLGTGFATFIAGDIGQRIILKSGLLPERMPSRNLNLRKDILTNN